MRWLENKNNFILLFQEKKRTIKILNKKLLNQKNLLKKIIKRHLPTACSFTAALWTRRALRPTTRSTKGSFMFVLKNKQTKSGNAWNRTPFYTKAVVSIPRHGTIAILIELAIFRISSSTIKPQSPESWIGIFDNFFIIRK